MYRSDVVGSLLRPSYLKDARASYEKGHIGHSEFKSIEDRAVDEAIDLQERAGLDMLTDGEMRRPFRRNDKGEEVMQPRPVVVSKLRRKRPLCAEDSTCGRGQSTLPKQP